MSRFLLLNLSWMLASGGQAPAIAFDHTYANYSAVLTKYVSNGGVEWKELKQDPSDLNAFLRECAGVTFEEYSPWMRAEKLSFLINLYNAATLKLVIDNYPISSIRNVGGFFGNPWNTEIVEIFGHLKGLGHILHEVIRPSFKEPRVHFALTLAAIDGPWLRSEPFTPEKLEAQLEEQERMYMRVRPELNRLENGVLYLSPLLDWYAEDFGKRDGILALAGRHYGEIPPGVKITYSKFSWSLR